MLDVFGDTVVVNRSNLLKPDKLSVAQIPEKGQESSIEWNDITVPLEIDEFDELQYNYLELHASNTSDEIRKYSL